MLVNPIARRLPRQPSAAWPPFASPRGRSAGPTAAPAAARRRHSARGTLSRWHSRPVADAGDDDDAQPQDTPPDDADDWEDFEPDPRLDPPWPDWDAFDDEPPEPDEGDFWSDLPDEDSW